MKKLAVICLTAVLLLSGCGAKDEELPPAYVPPETGATQAPSPSTPHTDVSLPADGEVIEITERLFIAQTNDIYINGEDYLGRTIRYEGLYKNSADWEDGSDEVYHYVIRYGPGCCGYDGEAGFEVRWDGEWPEVDDWVAVEGTLCEETFESGMKLLYIDVTSLTVMDERGAEFVAT